MDKELLEEKLPPGYVRLLARLILKTYGGKTQSEAIRILDSVKGMDYTNGVAFK